MRSQRQRHADLVVEVAQLLAWSRALRAQHRRQRFLGAAFADRAGDGDDPRCWCAHGRRSPGLPGRPGCRAPRAGGRDRHSASDDRPSRSRAAPFGKTLASTKIMAVESAGLLQRDEQIAWRRPRACRSTRRRAVQAAPAERGLAPVASAASFAVHSAVMATSRHRVAHVRRRRRRDAPCRTDDLALLMPLAGNNQDVAGVEAAVTHRRRWPSARSPISVARGAPARTAARIFAGILAARVVVGDDDPVRPGARRFSPMIGRLPGSRSPPQPKATTSFAAVVCGRSASSTATSASGLWA